MIMNTHYHINIVSGFKFVGIFLTPIFTTFLISGPSSLWNLNYKMIVVILFVLIDTFYILVTS